MVERKCSISASGGIAHFTLLCVVSGCAFSSSFEGSRFGVPHVFCTWKRERERRERG